MATFIENEHKYLEDPVTEPRFDKRRTWKTIFCSKLAKGIIVALIVATLIPTLAFFYALSAYEFLIIFITVKNNTNRYFRNVPDGTVQSFTCLIIEDFRLPCGNADISEEDCEKVNCCFNSTTQQCHHYLPSKHVTTHENGNNNVNSSIADITIPLLMTEHTKRRKTNLQLALQLYQRSN